MENKQKWLIVALGTASLILITVGVLVGYLLVDKGCSSNPLVYGVEIMNEVSEDYFTCSCTSSSGSSNFYFDEDGLRPKFLKNP